MFSFIWRFIMAISAAKQAFLDALAGVKQQIDTGDDTFSGHCQVDSSAKKHLPLGGYFVRC